MSIFKARILNSSIIGNKVLTIDFKKEDLGDLLKLLDKKIKVKVCGY